MTLRTTPKGKPRKPGAILRELHTLAPWVAQYLTLDEQLRPEPQTPRQRFRALLRELRRSLKGRR